MLSLKPRESPTFSLDPATMREIFEHAKPLGHYEDQASLNLGFGFLYYGLVRSLRPRHIVVIGSGYGFSVVCLALALKDNGSGSLSFVDPSYSLLKHGPLRTVGGTSQWDEPEKVRAHFARFGVEEQVTHYKETSAEFFAAYEKRRLPDIDLAFIDGSHAFADVRHDFLAVLDYTRRNSYVLMHDTNIYVRELVGHAGVKRWLNLIERERSAFEILDFPFSSGAALIRIMCEAGWRTDGE
jgi:predicted O-methyltransferase YrrM